MKWPWALTDCALNLTVRQRKNVLPSVYRSVKPHHLQLNYSQFMKKGGELLLPEGQLVATEDALHLTKCAAAACSFPGQDQSE